MANIENLALDLSSRFDVSFGLREFETRESFTCGVHEIDTLLQGGFPRAALSEIAGAASTNRTALVVSILARAFRGELGTNKASEASALELLKQVLAEN